MTKPSVNMAHTCCHVTACTVDLSVSLPPVLTALSAGWINAHEFANSDVTALGYMAVGKLLGSTTTSSWTCQMLVWA